MCQPGSRMLLRVWQIPMLAVVALAALIALAALAAALWLPSPRRRGAGGEVLRARERCRAGDDGPRHSPSTSHGRSCASRRRLELVQRLAVEARQGVLVPGVDRAGECG